MLAKIREQQEAAARAAGNGPKIYGVEDGDQADLISTLRKPFDVRSDPHYHGETELLLRHVPLKCIDEKTLVDKDSLREWIIFAIVEEDSFAQQYFDHIEKLKAMMVEVDVKIKKLPKIQFFDDKGKPLTEEKATAERSALFDYYTGELANLDREVVSVEKELKDHIQWRKTMGVHFKQVEQDKVTDTATWVFTLSGTSDAQEIEDLLLRKENWPGIKLAVGKKTGDVRFPPWAGRGMVPDGSNLTMPDYSTYRVNMIATHLARVPKGVGMYTELDRDNTPLASSAFSVFYGEYENGLKSGHGMEITDAGVFVGGFEEGFKRGRGRWDLADGTTIMASFKCSKKSPIPDSALFKNPYLEGEPDGLVEIFFGDGAYYRGQMTDGVITGGHGDYQSAMNEIQSGVFENGLLHGEKAYLKTAADEEFFGQYDHGLLHGLGAYFDRYGDSYEGYWQAGLRHGRGVAQFRNTGCYRGYYVNGLKHGRGSLEYLKNKSKKSSKSKADTPVPDKDNNPKDSSETNTNKAQSKSTENTASGNAHPTDEGTDANHVETVNHLANYELSPFAHVFSGFFLANGIANSGCLMNTKSQARFILARSNPRTTYGITRTLAREVRIEKEHHRKKERLHDTELFVRQELTRKKAKIYRRQRHFTKDMLFADSVGQKINLKHMIQKTKLREEHLKNMNEDKYQYKKALIPRLSTMNVQPMHIYQQAFQRLNDVTDFAPAADDVSEFSGYATFQRKQSAKFDPFALSTKHGSGKHSQGTGSAKSHSHSDSDADETMSVGSAKSGVTRFSDVLAAAPMTQSSKSTNDTNSASYINKKLFKLVLSDLEEARERQRFLKYDKIWQRAENAYFMTKKQSAEEG